MRKGKNDELANMVIDNLGGTGATARFCEVSDAAVSIWRRTGIPKPWRKFLMRARPKAFHPKTETQEAA